MTYPSPPPSYYQPPPMPGYGPPMGYYNPMAQPPVPGSIKTLGIIGIVLASVGLLNNGGGIALYAWAMSGASARQLLGAPSEQVALINLVGSTVSFCLSVFLLSAAIGTLRLRPWARAGLRLWASLYLASIAIWAVVSFGWLLPEMANAQRTAGTAVPGYEAGMYGGAAVMFVIMSVYPVFALIWMGKSHVKAAFGGEPAAIYPGGLAPYGAGWPPAGGYGVPGAYAPPPSGQYPPPPSPR